MKKIFLLVTAALSTSIIKAQVLLVDNSQVTIHSGSFLKAEGDVKIQGVGTILVNGELQISGNIINNAPNSFLPADGKVVLNGAQQYISGSSPVYFPTLELKGSGKKIMQQDIFAGNTITTADNILLLNDQVLQLNSKQLTILSSSTNAIQRSSNGFIESETNSQPGYSYLQWNIKSNAGNYVFPFGNSTANIFLPINADVQKAGTGNNGYIRAAIYPTDPTQSPNNRPFPIGVSNMDDIAGLEAASKTIDRFWILEAGNYSDKPVANIKLTYLDNEWDNNNGSTNSISENLLAPHVWNGTKWLMETGTNEANNKIIILNNNFTNTIWRATQVTGVAPITLLDLSVVLNNNGNADIKWITTFEINTSHFEIEKSTNGNQFTYLKTATATGSSISTQTYYGTDNQVASGITFYRIKMINLDGSFKYSNMVSIKKVTENEVNIYPNPVVDNIFIKWPKPISTNITCTIRDASGKIVLQWNVFSGSNTTTKNLRALPSGTYAVSWIDGSLHNSRLFIKK